MLKELIKLFIRTNGRNPNNLELLQLKFKAAQQSGKGKVIEFPRDKITDWTKARPQPPEVKIIDGIQTTRGMGDLFERQLKKTVKKTEAQIKKEIEKQNKESIQRFKDKMKDPPEDLAGGGLAGMLGEPTYADENHRVPFKGGKLALLEGLGKLMDEFFPGTTKVGKRSKPYPEKVQEKMDLRKAFENFNNKIATQEALSKGSKKMRGPIENVNKKSVFDPVSTDATTWLQQGKFFNPKALDMYGKKVPANWIEVEKKAAQKLIDDLGPLDVSPNHPNYKYMKASRQSAKDRLASIKITEALGGNIQMHDWIRMNRKNIDIDDYIKKPGAKKVVDELSGIKKIMIKDKESGKLYEKGSEIDKSIQLEKKAEKMLSKMSDAEIELRSEFPGISDDLIKNILADDNPQRIAEVKAAMKEAMKMQEKGMGVEEIINIFKKKPTKHASGGLAGMLGE